MIQTTYPRNNFSEILIKGFKDFANFKDRMRRSDFWFFSLFFFIFEIILFIALLLTLEEHPHYKGYIYYTFSPAVEVIFLMYELFVLLPRISSLIRRLHDIGKNGLNFLYIFLPIFGIFILLYYLCLDSQREKNKYGPSTKYINSDEINAPLSQNEEQNNQFSNSPILDENEANIQSNNIDIENSTHNQYNSINEDDN